MRELLIAELKRAVEILESKPELKRYELKVGSWGKYNELDRELVELAQIMKLVRKHSIAIEKTIKEWSL